MNIHQLSEITGVSERNIKRYIHNRLIAPAEGRTRSASYSEEHRRSLLRIEALRAAGLNLEQIRVELSPTGTATPPDHLIVERRYRVGDGVFLVFQDSRMRGEQPSEAMIVSRCRELLLT
jgi:DNA-binding transcriptional MerR regulator